MATAKTTTLAFRIEPGLKETLPTAADREHRSIFFNTIAPKRKFIILPFRGRPQADRLPVSWVARFRGYHEGRMAARCL